MNLASTAADVQYYYPWGHTHEDIDVLFSLRSRKDKRIKRDSAGEMKLIIIDPKLKNQYYNTGNHNAPEVD